MLFKYRLKSILLFVLMLAALISTVNGECKYVNDGSYLCKNIVDVFPNIYYGNYKINCVDCNFKIFSKNTLPFENKITSLNVSDNGIEEVTTKAFSALKNVEFLYLQHNKIAKIAPDAFNIQQRLYELHLENNYLTTLEKGFLNGCESNSVSLSNNKITELNDNVFEGSINIMILELQNNLIRTIQKNAFAGLNSLEYLVLENNQLCHFPLGVFQHLKSLRHLILDDNKFTRFPIGAFSGLKYLETLSLRKNQLAEFDAQFLIPFNHLSKLDISSNGIFYLDAHSIYTNVPSLKFINLENNLYSCSVLMSLLQYFKRVNIEVVIKHENYELQNINGIVCIDKIITQPIAYDFFLQVAEKDGNSNVSC